MIFIDTGAFISRYIAKDEHHTSSVRFWDQLRDLRERLFTSNFVLDETITLLGRRGGYSFAAEKARKFYTSKVLTILRPTIEHEQKAVAVFEKYADQKISFTDCTSFVLMKQHGIDKVFSFDGHFVYAGYLLLPKYL